MEWLRLLGKETRQKIDTSDIIDKYNAEMNETSKYGLPQISMDTLVRKAMIKYIRDKGIKTSDAAFIANQIKKEVG